jgi:hypothetical protein
VSIVDPPDAYNGRWAELDPEVLRIARIANIDRMVRIDDRVLLAGFWPGSTRPPALHLEISFSPLIFSQMSDESSVAHVIDPEVSPRKKQ